MNAIYTWLLLTAALAAIYSRIGLGSDIRYAKKQCAEKVESLMPELLGAPWAGSVRIRTDDRHIPEGYRCIRIFPATATKEHMLDRLREMTGARDTVTFGSEKGHCDVFIENADRDLVVKELKRRFEPVSLKGWRNVFNWR